MGGMTKCKFYEIFCTISQIYIIYLLNQYKLKAFACKKAAPFSTNVIKIRKSRLLEREALIFLPKI